MPIENFGYKNAWLAIRSASSAQVAQALAVRPVPSNWERGIAAAYEWPGMSYGQAIFISPPLDGWVLCVGTALFAFADSRPPAFGDLVSLLARQLDTEVQFFATHRVVEAHAWARASPAGLARQFLYVGESGETVSDVGSRTDAEGAVRDYTTEANVMTVAGQWSVDPTSLSERFPEAGDGLVAQLALPKPAQAGPRAQPSSPSKRPWWKFW